MKKTRKIRGYFLGAGILLVIIGVIGVFYFLSGEGEEEDFFRENLSENNSELEENYSEEGFNEEDEEEYFAMNVSSGRARTSSEIISSTGVLKIINSIHYNFTSGSLRFIHRENATEDYGNHDSTYYAMYDTSGIASKIVSIFDGEEL